MAQTSNNPYPYFNLQGQGFFNPQYGIDTTTGKRDAERSSKAFIETPFLTETGSVQFPGTPSYEVAKDVNAELYENIFDRLAKKSLALEGKQQLLGLGSGLAFSAATLPIAERLRNVDYQLGLQADIDSPTRKAARDASRQAQLTSSINAEADYLRALAAVRQGAASGINVSV